MRLEITYKTSELFKTFKGYIGDSQSNNKTDLVNDFIAYMYRTGFQDKIQIVSVKEVG